MASVYVLSASSDPGVPRYVGRTKYDDPQRRLKDHLWNAKIGKKYHVYNWIRKTQAEGHTVIATLIESELSWEESAKTEMNMISTLKAQGFDLTNMTDGGEGAIGVTRSAEYRAKLSRSKTGTVFSEEHKEKLARVWKGRKHSEETKRRMSESQKGRTFSEESKAKMSAAARNRRKRTSSK